MIGLLFLILTIIAFIMLFIYWIRTLIVMAKGNILWAIGGFFVSPLVQIIYFFSQKDTLDFNDKSVLQTFFYSNIALFVFMILASMTGTTFGG